MIFRKARPSAAVAFCAVFLAIAISDASSGHAAAASLFGPATAADMRAAPPRNPSSGTMRDALGQSRGAALRDRLVSLNASELARIVPVGAATAAPAERLNRAKNFNAAVTLDLFSDVSLTAQRTDVEAPEEGGFVWVGEDRGPRHAFVTLVINNNEILGHIQTGGKLYSIEPVSGGLHRIIEIDQSKIKDDVHLPWLPKAIEKRGEGAQPAPSAVATLAPINTTIKVLVAHTKTAKAEVGTASQMQQRINLAISLANQAFTRSGVLITFVRVGGATEVDYNEASFYGGLNSSANYPGVLCDLSEFNCASQGVANNHTAAFAAVRTKRNTLEADLVVLMRKQGAGCGIAWQPDPVGNLAAADKIYGFSVVTSTPFNPYNCIEGNTLAHETGHNQGLNHDRVQYKKDTAFDDGDADLGPIPPATQYNFGHVNKTKGFFTIMSYQSSCPSCTRIPYFSTPLKKYPNTATGTPVGVAQGVTGNYGAADAVRRLNLNRAIVGAYR